MNKLKRYEQLIADKLQQVPVPDKEAGWQQMKKLLDEEQPPRSGGGWKWTAILAIIVTIGLWWTVEANKENKKTIVSSPIKSGNNNLLKESTKTLNEDISTHSIVPPAVDKNASASVSNATAADAGNEGSVATPGNNANVQAPVPSKQIPDSYTASGPTLAESLKNKDGKTNTDNQAGNLSGKITERETITSAALVKKNKKTGIYQQSTNTNNNDIIAGEKLFRRKKLPGSNVNNSRNQYPAVKSVRNLSYPAFTNSEEEDALLQKQAELFQNWTERKTTQSSEYSNSELIPPVAGLSGKNWEPAETQLTAAALRQKDKIARLKEQEKLARKTDRRDRLQTGLSNLFKPFSLKADGEPWWAVGLSLNSAVATGSQTRYNYNINAKNNLALDFLPSPYVQFHINDNVYLQTELNLSAPQHTPQILVSQNGFAPAGSNLQRSIFVQKLYYFNWPVSLHYSPVNNLFLGTGIQFSSLQSGVSLIEDRDINTNRLVNNVVQKFKDDSTAARFKTNEWRWQTGADYYWNRFTLGMRYNQSFSNLLLNKTITPLSYNNNSFLLFVRYNLFEGKRKDNGSNKSTARY